MANYVENGKTIRRMVPINTKEDGMSLRADSRENRLRLIEAAEAVFADQGFDAPLDVIAKRTGVSRMTLYRHFKDRETLCFAICERNVLKLESRAEALKGDPNAFAQILDMMLVMFATNQGVVEGLTRQQTHQAQLDSLRQRVVDLLIVPLARAQAAGLVKKGLQQDDLSLLMCMFGGAVGEGTIEARTARVHRALTILQFGFLCASDDDPGLQL